MAEVTRPPSLRSFLDAGCDVTTLPGWECLADSVLLSYPADPAKRTRKARWLRSLAEAWLRGERTFVDPDGDPVEQDVVTRFLWEVECLEDPGMAERLEAALPAEKRAFLVLASIEQQWPEELS